MVHLLSLRPGLLADARLDGTRTDAAAIRTVQEMPRVPFRGRHSRVGLVLYRFAIACYISTSLVWLSSFSLSSTNSFCSITPFRIRMFLSASYSHCKRTKSQFFGKVLPSNSFLIGDPPIAPSSKRTSPGSLLPTLIGSPLLLFEPKVRIRGSPSLSPDKPPDPRNPSPKVPPLAWHQQSGFVIL
jgi:hypothetical protein